MLKIWVNGFRKDCLRNTSRYFDLHKKPSWFNIPWVKRVIKEIDDVDAIKDEYMESSLFGAISPDRLSSGCKCLILLYENPLCNVYASRAGDNCSDYILELAEKTDVIITLHHFMKFERDFDAELLDINHVVHNRRDLYHYMLSLNPYEGLE